MIEIWDYTDPSRPFLCDVRYWTKVDLPQWANTRLDEVGSVDIRHDDGSVMRYRFKD